MGDELIKELMRHITYAEMMSATGEQKKEYVIGQIQRNNFINKDTIIIKCL